MTTRRPTPKPSRPPSNRRCHTACSGSGSAAAAPAPPPHASRAPRAPPDAPAAASSLASDAPAAGTRALGSTAGSTAGPDTSAHTPCAGKSAIPAAGLLADAAPLVVILAMSHGRFSLPRVRPGRMGFILLGHSFPWRMAPSLLTSDAPPSCPAPHRRAREGPQSRLDGCSPPTRRMSSGAKKTRRRPGRRRTRCAFALKDTKAEVYDRREPTPNLQGHGGAAFLQPEITAIFQPAPTYDHLPDG